VYDRLEADQAARVEKLTTAMKETAAKHAPEVPADRRENLCREKATISIMARRARNDVWNGSDDSGSARGLTVDRTETAENGHSYTTTRLNPASRARHALRRRQHEIAEELRLWPGFRDE
jgi:hypothetical protein